MSLSPRPGLTQDLQRYPAQASRCSPLVLLLFVLLALAVLAACAPATPPAGAPAGNGPPAGAVAAQVVRVVDGGTIRVRMGGAEYPVRYILINAPEADQPFGAEATAANRRLVEGRTVYLLKDVSETDRFNRLLRYVFLADGTHVNAELVRQGYAQVATFPPNVTREPPARRCDPAPAPV